MKPILPRGEQFVGCRNDRIRIEAKLFRQGLRRRAGQPGFRCDQLQVAKRDRVEEHANAAVLAHHLGQLIEDSRALFFRNRVNIPGAETDPQASELFEFGLDLSHGSAPVAVHDAEVQALFGKLARRGQSETTGAAENQRPVPLVERGCHYFPSL